MKKKIQIYFNAPITLGFVAICLIALLLQIITNGWTTNIFFSTYSSSLLNPLTYIRLVGHVFGHANFNHLVSNALYILLLGPMLEEKHHNRMIVVILVTAVTTGLINNIFFPNTQLLGASGVVFAFIIWASITGREKGIPITLIFVAILWIGSEFYDAFALSDSISQLTHIIGGCCGGGVGMFFKNKK